MSTSGLKVLTASRQGIVKEHQLSVAQDQKPFKKMQIFIYTAMFFGPNLFHYNFL
jgi:hypothetical protein